MKSRPMLFSAPMVRALLAGTKTRTRRVCAAQPQLIDGLWHALYPWGEGGHGIYETETAMRDEYMRLMFAHAVHGKPGDQLWVRETWAAHPLDGQDPPTRVLYRADGANHWCWLDRAHERGRVEDDYPDWQPERWRPSIFMPRWASRITLEITDVRVQRLQDISEADALAEGAIVAEPLVTSYGRRCSRGAFASLWTAINGKRPGCSWEANPYVWALDFRRVTA